MIPWDGMMGWGDGAFVMLRGSLVNRVLFAAVVVVYLGERVFHLGRETM